MAKNDLQFQLLEELIEQLSFQNASNGSVFIDGTNNSQQFRGFVVNTDVQFTTLVDDKGNDMLTQFNYTGKTISAGAIIRPLGKKSKIVNVTVSSGSVLGVL